MRVGVRVRVRVRVRVMRLIRVRVRVRVRVGISWGAVLSTRSSSSTAYCAHLAKTVRIRVRKERVSFRCLQCSRACRRGGGRGGEGGGRVARSVRGGGMRGV